MIGCELGGGGGDVPVRGKAMLWTPLREMQGGRSVGGSLGEFWKARSKGGQVRLVPAWTERVRLPQAAQNWLRLFQSRMLLAWARMAAVGWVLVLCNGVSGVIENHILSRE